MRIHEALGLNLDRGDVISFVGGGGKTTTIFQLGYELKELNKRVLITTTTSIYNVKEEEYDYFFLKDLKDFSPKNGTITVLGHRVEDGKLLGINHFQIEEIAKKELFHFILIEADTSYEPLVPDCTTKTVILIGLDSLGQRIGDIAHRPKIFTEITDTKLLDVIDENIVLRLILSSDGLLKGVRGSPILILNKAVDERTILKGDKIRSVLYEKGFNEKVLVADIINKRFY